MRRLFLSLSGVSLRQVDRCRLPVFLTTRELGQSEMRAAHSQ